MDNYCLPIISEDKSEITTLIDRYSGEYRWFEIWLDYLDGDLKSFLRELTQKHSSKLVILFRRKNLEPSKLNLEMVKGLIAICVENDLLIDFDVNAQADLIEYTRSQFSNARLLLSYHNYSATPDSDFLEDILAKMNKFQASIYKIACMTDSLDDALLLMIIGQKLKLSGKNCIVLGMGEFGLMTRIFGAKYLNYMNFAPLNKEQASAPGQLTIGELQVIFDTLGF